MSEEEADEELNDPGNEDPGSLMDDAQVPLKDPDELRFVEPVAKPLTTSLGDKRHLGKLTH